MSTGAETVRNLLETAERLLSGSSSARLDAEVLLQQTLRAERTWLYAHPEAPVGAAQACDFRLLINRRSEGYPVAYLTGEKEFWSLPFMVNGHTLIPRPETELLVETALHFLPGLTPADVLDLGTGCGAIAAAVASERPLWRLTATDISSEALAVARENARRLGLNAIDFVRSDWFAQLHGRAFDLVLCNPPYVAGDDSVLAHGVRFEPRLALDGGHLGLEALRIICGSAARHLLPGGRLLLEHGAAQGQEVRRLLAQHGFLDIRTLRDTANLDRISMGRKA